ncbi:LOW QUALITY PROTEIN: hypothetical protein Cgig2_006545 [Carnegiea gigantea]|uniref:Uncharacterized protein n=1 Tax=Carnegiea gigantea TaxID=171969 RepID=A0A9Q1JV84_9CARY|nr:LOW QUALITY PROTEIN: hypothetical protein Cgig2_006545 [Carnegiea gigantea]
MEMEVMDNKFFNVGLLVVVTPLVAKIISAPIMQRFIKRLPPVIKFWPPLIGGLLHFLKGPIIMLREEYPKLAILEVSAHFFKASESDLSQQEVYRFNVPTFGPGSLMSAIPSGRSSFASLTEALRVNKLKGYVDRMVVEAQDYFSKWGDSGECFIDSKCKNGRPTSEGEVTGLLIAALFAGQHISSITSTWTGAYLLRFKEYFVAVVEKQRTLMKKHGKEHDIPKGHIVVTSPAFANRLSHIYENPDSYDPD